MPAPEPFLLGVNYWPRRKAMYWWTDFDRDETADEFDLIADLGMTVVRIFLLWDDWQPAPDKVSERCLQHLAVVCDLAADRGLKLDVTFFTGHMSGPNWVPEWLRDAAAPLPSPAVRQVISSGRVVGGSYRNMFTDEVALDAERLLLRTVVGRFRDHPGVWMWNLGNEPDLFARPPDAEAGRAWVREMTDLVHTVDPVRPVTCGLHAASLLDDNGLRVDHVFSGTDIAVMHGYPMYVPWARHPLDPDFVPFLCSLTSALAGKPTLAEEWGGCTAPGGGPSVTWRWYSYGRPRTQFLAAEEEMVAYVGGVLDGLVTVGSPGAMLWCFADYSPELWDRPPCQPDGARHERHFGLIRPDGSLKPHALEVQRRAGQRRPVAQSGRPVQLGMSADDYYLDPAGHARRLYSHWLAD